MQIPVTETVSIASLNLDEKWLQEQIWDNPSCLGLGDLVGVTKERVVSSGGRLDILLKNPDDDAMYEVEVTLGETDPSHIIRSIEYWDLVKRKWPQRQHFAVLIAERITKRYFNVIQILSGSVPLIAIQVNVIKSTNGYLLHFNKILDVFEEVDDDVSPDPEGFDEAYWRKKSQDTLNAAIRILGITSPIYERPRLVFCKYSINIVREGNNQMMVCHRSSGNIRFQFRYGAKRAELAQLLEAHSIQFQDKHKQFYFTIGVDRIMNGEEELFSQIARLNNQWWLNVSSED